MRTSRNLLFAALLTGLALLIAGCGLTAPLHDPDKAATESTAVNAARVAIDEGNALLTAVNRTIGANVEAGVWTKSQAQAYLDESKALGKRLDQAREALRLGDIRDARAQADAVKALITALHARVAAEARRN